LARRKYCCIAEPRHNKEGQQARMRNCPALKVSVF